jgi:integrase
MAMRWVDLDLKAGVWQIPAEHAKNGRAHLVPLPASSVDIVKGRRSAVAKDEARAFPGMSADDTAYRQLSELTAGFVWKDLRRTMATRLAELGWDETTIGRVLNHAKVSVTARHYNQHPYIAEMRQALDSWDRELARIVANEPKVGADVVAIGARR